MTDQLHQLVREIADVTGAAMPLLLEEGAPVLAPAELEADSREPYLIGLIGGKDVGKSALVNALVGQEITARTSYGPGTEIVIAYTHRSRLAWLRELLDAIVPNQHRIVAHDIDALSRQVLLDLPDIDSHWAAHIEVTRRMLKHMLYPIWIQSIEKYADQRPRQLLAQVASGNAPQNFIFCLNKTDQIVAREGEPAARELAHDYAHRIAETLKLKEPPRIWMISAIHPDRFDLPQLRALLSQQRSEDSVSQSRQDAGRRQGLSLAEWIDRQELPQRQAALERLEADAEEELAARVVGPLVDKLVPAVLDDPGYRLALGDELMSQRIARWPIVNILHVLMGPLLSVVRKRLPLPQQRALEGPRELVDVHLATFGELAGGRGRVATVLASAFAVLQQSSPLVGRLYAQRKPWEPMSAEAAEEDLARRLATTIEQQRSVLRLRLPTGGLIGGLMRLLLTVGVALWFPIIQPLLEAYLDKRQSVRQLLTALVSVLGANYLLQNAAMLLLYFIVLWLAIKWNTQRRVDGWLDRWKKGENLDPALSLTGQILDWARALLDPITTALARITDLLRRFTDLRKSLPAEKAA